MTVAIHRPARLRLSRPGNRTTTPAMTTGDELTYQEVYEMLSEAAHLVTRASRQLRSARQLHDGFALQTVADDIHENIRRLPRSVTDRPARHRHRFDSSGC